MLNYEFPPIGGGGANAFLHLLEEYAGTENLDIDVLTTSSNTPDSIEQFSPNIKLYKIGIRKKSLHFWTKREVLEWLFRARKQTKKLICHNQYQFAHAFFGFPTGWLTYCERKRLPYILSLRGSDVPGANPRLKLDYKILGNLFRKIWKHAAFRIANSSGLAQRAETFAPDLDYKVIPNGVDTDHFTPAQTKPPMQPFKLLSVGRLSQVKRLDLAIQAVARARTAGLDVELTLVGNGNLMHPLKSLARQLNIPAAVHFTDWISPDKISGIYRQHHAFLLTSINEGMNNAMLEAMACGLPIISTPCEGTRELITQNGLIIDQPTPENIAKAIVEMAENQEKHNQMSRISRSMAENFSWKKMAQQYLALYKTFAR